MSPDNLGLALPHLLGCRAALLCVASSQSAHTCQPTTHAFHASPSPLLCCCCGHAGVIVRTFDQRDLDQSGFTLKVTALLLSSFQVGRPGGQKVLSQTSAKTTAWYISGYKFSMTRLHAGPLFVRAAPCHWT